MYGQQALGRLLVLYKGPLSKVERDRYGGFEFDLRAHATRFSLCAEVETVQCMATRHIQHLKLALNVQRELLLPRVWAVADGLIETTLAILSQVLQRGVIVAARVTRVGD